MYFLLAAAKRYLCHLDKAVIGILIFIGLKMLADAGILNILADVFYHIDPRASLVVVALLLVVGVLASYLRPSAESEGNPVTGLQADTSK
jgi:tellurite resistance protein TerC